MKVHALYRYPVKGLSAEPLKEAELRAGCFFPGDRLYAIENGPSGFDSAAPAYRPKTRFLMLMKNARLAELTSRYDDATHVLTISRAGSDQACGDLRTEDGRATIERFLQTFCADEARGPARILRAPDGFRFTDSIRSGFVSILNLASVQDLQEKLGSPVDALRFRANVLVTGWGAWREEESLGRLIRIGDAELRVLQAIDRCAATHVDPASGVRDLDVTGALQAAFGRITCGVYAKVEKAGRIAPGDPVEIAT